MTLRTSAAGLHSRFFLTGHLGTSFIYERRGLGGGGRRNPLHPDLAQLGSAVVLHLAVHKVLQESSAKRVALHVQHRAGTISEGDETKEDGLNKLCASEQYMLPHQVVVNVSVYSHNPVNSEDEGDVFGWESYCFQDNSQGEHPPCRDTSRSHTGCCSRHTNTHTWDSVR